MLYVIVCFAADKGSGKAIHVVQSSIFCNRQEKWQGYPCCSKLYTLLQRGEVARLSMLYVIVCFAADKRSGKAMHVVQNGMLCNSHKKWQGYPCCTKLYILQQTRELSRLSMLYKIVCFAADKRSGKAIHVVQNGMLCNRQEMRQGYPCCTKLYALQQTREMARLSML